MNENQPTWQDKQAFSLRRELEALFRNRYLIGACVAVFLVVVTLYNFGARPLYDAVSVVSLEQMGASAIRARGGVDANRLQAALREQVRFLESPEAALLAVTDAPPILKTELAKGPMGDWKQRIKEEALFRLGTPIEYGSALPDLVESFRGRLSTEMDESTKWLTIRFVGYDPHAAVEAVNRLVSVYLAENEREIKSTIGATKEDLENRVALTQGQVVESMEKLKAYDRKEGAEGVRATREFLEKELARLQDSLITARQNRLTRRALFEESSRVSASEMMSLPQVRDDGEVANARSRIAELQAEISSKSLSLGELHPEIVDLRNELAVAQALLKSRLDVIRESNTRDYRMAAREEGDLTAMIQSTQSRLAQLNQNSVQLSFIETQAQAGKNALGELIARSVREADEQVFFSPKVLQAPEPSQTPVSPQKAKNFQVALVAGLLTGLVLAFMRTHLDETLKTPEDVKASFATPLLGMVPMLKRPGFDLLGPEEGESIRLFEAYRVLRTNLMLSHEAPKSHPLILVTSSRAHEGKTTTSCGLAVAMARAGMRVLLIDGDLRRASLSRLLSARNRFGLGLTDAISGKPLDTCIHETGVPGLSILPSGTSRPNPAELLNRDSLRTLIDTVRPNYDWILCDAPPVLAVADAAILARLVDSVLVVVGANSTPAGSIRATLEQLETVGARVRGLILNSVDLSRDSHYYKYYYAAQYEDYSEKPKHGGRLAGGIKKSV